MKHDIGYFTRFREEFRVESLLLQIMVLSHSTASGAKIYHSANIYHRHLVIVSHFKSHAVSAYNTHVISHDFITSVFAALLSTITDSESNKANL